MTYEITRPGTKITEVDVKRLEKKLNVHLPIEYKDFLIRNNGGRVHPRYFLIGGPIDDNIGQVQLFYSIDHQIESCRPDWNYEVFLGRIPKNYFPIAAEDCGDIICLSLDPKNYGSIHYWDHNGEGVSRNFENVYEAAPTFTEFLNGLFDIDAEKLLSGN